MVEQITALTSKDIHNDTCFHREGSWRPSHRERTPRTELVKKSYIWSVSRRQCPSITPLAGPCFLRQS